MRSTPVSPGRGYDPDRDPIQKVVDERSITLAQEWLTEATEHVERYRRAAAATTETANS
jgi:hypothetical protein